MCRIENALVASGAPAGIITKTIAAVLEPRNKVRDTFSILYLRDLVYTR